MIVFAGMGNDFFGFTKFSVRAVIERLNDAAGCRSYSFRTIPVRFDVKMMILPLKMTILPLKMIILPLKMMILPLKMMIFVTAFESDHACLQSYWLCKDGTPQVGESCIS